MKVARLQPGDEIYIQPVDDPPGSVLLIPALMVADWIERGRGSLRDKSSQRKR
ncbi:MAG: hypothetical protein M3083_00665 [Actinomycetota bacterium]|nr:hypothetical protein [Actinomycetota bacterium]MDQ6945084.1 hypothetical protein [Actinomycetota bacterium]